jgi:hypothetical protein
MFKQYKNPILLADLFDQPSDAETAVNAVLGDNPGYCLAGVLLRDYSNANYANERQFVFDEDWGVPNPIHSVVFVENSYLTNANLATALSDNPGYHLVDLYESHGDPHTGAFLLGSS